MKYTDIIDLSFVIYYTMTCYNTNTKDSFLYSKKHDWPNVPTSMNGENVKPSTRLLDFFY